MLKVGIGSTNPSKIRGVEKAFKDFFTNIEIIPIKIAEGIYIQPINLDETFDGAYKRAYYIIRRSIDCDYYVGIEAGLFYFSNNWYAGQVACIIDKDNRVSYGISPCFQIPKKFAEKIIKKEAKELEDIVNEIYGLEDIGDREGFIGIISKNKVSRIDLS